MCYSVISSLAEAYQISALLAVHQPSVLVSNPGGPRGDLEALHRVLGELRLVCFLIVLDVDPDFVEPIKVLNIVLQFRVDMSCLAPPVLIHGMTCPRINDLRSLHLLRLAAESGGSFVGGVEVTQKVGGHTDGAGPEEGPLDVIGPVVIPPVHHTGAPLPVHLTLDPVSGLVFANGNPCRLRLLRGDDIEVDAQGLRIVGDVHTLYVFLLPPVTRISTPLCAALAEVAVREFGTLEKLRRSAGFLKAPVTISVFVEEVKDGRGLLLRLRVSTLKREPPLHPLWFLLVGKILLYVPESRVICRVLLLLLLLILLLLLFDLNRHPVYHRLHHVVVTDVDNLGGRGALVLVIRVREVYNLILGVILAGGLFLPELFTSLSSQRCLLWVAHLCCSCRRSKSGSLLARRLLLLDDIIVVEIDDFILRIFLLFLFRLFDGNWSRGGRGRCLFLPLLLLLLPLGKETHLRLPHALKAEFVTGNEVECRLVTSDSICVFLQLPLCLTEAVESLRVVGVEARGTISIRLRPD
eukprot:Hpha_TRINITY_DN15198_c2_g3::TRINITY_DN15198_c2_g3_i1::g.127342::m.127342